MTSTADDSRSRAADILEARLEDTRVNAVSKAVRVAATFALGLLTGGVGADDALPGLDLVVTRTDTGAEVLRVRAGLPQEADRMLQATRRDLDEMTVEQFVRSWRDIGE